ncbi:hypothetical protein A5893_05200 [Pedobacter psychrophilus]|uniref:Phosphodiesterase n=1 Tax=Pedobacter psychrophilus TaxID=1826909 RepID=A0A179DH51_9SPHI|nr:ectonucleotide pyrophosphatase/phosphodiesterase [Pedobacter psychrophilus]OAQ40351.1 hypothetical protein A5893_05200 [Pedobacter psychrophilus]
MKFKSTITGAFILIGLANLTIAQVTRQRVNPPHENTTEQAKKPYLILVSADGFRYDYAEKYNAKSLLNQATKGVKAESMIPVFPSSTGPNHFSLVTGLYPVHNGIVGNDFYDPTRKVFKGEESNDWLVNDPIWISAEKQGMVTASLSFIASRQEINGVKTSYYYNYTEPRIGMTERVEIIKKWLSLPEKVRPHFIAVYNNETDHAGHGHGPDSEEVKEAVGQMDSFVSQLQSVIDETGLPVNVVFVSDHGMTKIEKKPPMKIPASIDTSKFVIADQRTIVSIHAKEAKDILPLFNKLKEENNPNFDVYLQKDLPKDLHFEMKEDKFNRIGDIVLLAKWPNIFTKVPAGSHGFNPYEVKDVHASFYAWGPAFKQGITVKSFPNVEVYGMMMKLLSLKPEISDGTGELAKKILK